MSGALGVLRQRPEQSEPGGEIGDRFAMGIAPGSISRRLLPGVDGLFRLAPALEVDGELGRDLPRPGAIARRQPRANAPVQVQPPRCPQPFVQHLLVQHMPRNR